MPEYFHTTKQRWLDGYIALKLDVLKTGSVANVEMLDEIPEGFDKTILDAVKTWTFKPATVNGVPVDDFSIIEAFRLILDPDVGQISAASPRFSRLYDEAYAAYQRGDTVLARKLVTNLSDNVATDLYEFGRAEWLHSEIEIKDGNDDEALRILARVTLCPPCGFFDEKDLPHALKDRAVLEIRLKKYGEALQTFDQIQALAPLAPNDQLVVYVSKLRAQLASDQPFTHDGTISDGTWEYVPLRRAFAVTNVNGHIDHIHLECPLQRSDLAFQLDTRWNLPQNWAACRIKLIGDNATTFSIVEFQNPAAPAN